MSAIAPSTGGLLHFLRRVKLFSELSAESLEKLAVCLKLVKFPPSEVIMREGAPGESMHIIKSGLVEVRKKDVSTGIDFLIARLGEYEVVGEMSLLTWNARSARVTTISATEVLILTRSDFQNLFRRDPEMYLGLARVLSERLERANERFSIEYVNLLKSTLDPAVVGILPRSLCLLHKLVPISQFNNAITLAMVDPANLVAFDDVRRYLKGAIIEPKVCTAEDFRKFMETIYPEMMGITGEATRRKEEKRRSISEPATQSLEDLEAEILTNVEIVQDEEETPATAELVDQSRTAPIVRLANNILALAIQKRASDIHIEPEEDGVFLRLRIDGVLRIQNIFSKKIQLPLTSRFKILSKMDIAERRLPQDGRISIKQDDRSVDFRVSTVPTKFGETLVLRVLDKLNSLFELDKIIVHPQTIEKVRWMIRQPYGILYVTGPTGSGKTTTLYSLLTEMNSPEIKITTVEDPIEYHLKGLCQVQTHSDIGLDFARVLRAFLRQDPDVIFVGETRDRETAKISVESAITGHLVLTTLHTNDAPTSFTRLQEMGVEPFLMANSAIGIVAQRLARRICPHCKVQTEVDAATLAFFGYTRKNAPPFYKGEGCDRCEHSGKRGRVGIFEVLTMNEELKRAVATSATPNDIRDLAQKNGMKTLKEYAMFLMAEGFTSVDEVFTNLVIEA
jgi:type IV pilus assembly protein PilB